MRGVLHVRRVFKLTDNAGWEPKMPIISGHPYPPYSTANIVARPLLAAMKCGVVER